MSFVSATDSGDPQAMIDTPTNDKSEINRDEDNYNFWNLNW